MSLLPSKKEVMQNISNTVGVKTLLEEGRLDQKRMYLENIRSANIERLNYSLEIATAAGIKKTGIQQRPRGKG